MGFRYIVKKTLIDLSGWARTSLLVLIGSLVPVLVALSWRSSLLSEHSYRSLQWQTYYLSSNFLAISMIWTAGFFLAFMVATNGAGAIAKESSDGTLLSLVSKPISRRDIVLGKFTAIVINALLIEALILFLLVFIVWAIMPAGFPAFWAIAKLIPWIMLFALMVTMLFAAISLAVSSLIESQIRVMASVIAVVFVVFGLWMILHLMNFHGGEAYRTYHLYILDFPYHLCNTFVPAMRLAFGGDLLPVWNLSALQVFMGGLVSPPNLQFLGSYEVPAQPIAYVSPVISALLVLGATALAMFGAVRALERKDVG